MYIKKPESHEKRNHIVYIIYKKKLEKNTIQQPMLHMCVCMQELYSKISQTFLLFSIILICPSERKKFYIQIIHLCTANGQEIILQTFTKLA